MANIILPVQLCGVVHANFYHVAATITLKLEPSAYGTPQVILCGCDIKIPFADVCIECGGLLGDLINLFFRQEISGRVRSMAPGRICAMLPEVINERINPMLARIPQSVSFTQMETVFTGLLGRPVPAHCRSPQCQARLTTTKLPPSHSAVGASPPRNPPSPTFNRINGVTDSRNNIAEAVASAGVVTRSKFGSFQHSVRRRERRVQLFGSGNDRRVDSETPAVLRGIGGRSEDRIKPLSANESMAGSNGKSFGQPPQKAARLKRGVAAGFENLSLRPLHPFMQQSQQTAVLLTVPTELSAQQLQKQRHQKALQKLPSHTSAFSGHNSKRVAASGQYTMTPPDQFKKSAVNGVPVVVQVPKGYGRFPSEYKSDGVYQAAGNVGGLRGKSSDPCSTCPPAGDSFGAIGNLIKEQLNLRKAANLVLTTQLLRSYATFYDYNLDLSGEFSPNGRGGTPFPPFPMQWPTPVGSSMIEILISDFTVNSLLYWIHKANVLSFRIGPETPGIGALLITTCDVNDYSEEDFENKALLFRLLRLRQLRGRYIYHQRSRRQAITAGDSNGDDLGSLEDLADLGICLGDIIPAIKEEHPNRTLALLIHSARAPSISISRRGGGSIQLDLVAFVDIYLDKTNVRVGTITVTAVADVMIRIMGQRIIANASLPVLKLMDRDQTLGLQQEAFDNLASLAKDMILKAANQQFSKGIELSLPTSNLPVNIINPHFRLLDHAIYVGSDFTIAPSAIQMLS